MVEARKEIEKVGNQIIKGGETIKMAEDKDNTTEGDQTTVSNESKITIEHTLNGTISDSESQVRANVFKFELNVFCHG